MTGSIRRTSSRQPWDSDLFEVGYQVLTCKRLAIFKIMKRKKASHKETLFSFLTLQLN